MEVHHCISHLVYTLAQGAGGLTASNGYGRDLLEMAEAAGELFTPVPDHEEAAIQEGWTARKGAFVKDGETAFEFGDEDDEPDDSDWQKLCYLEGIDADEYAREIYEHWIVSDWLARRLEAHGERVSYDFAGLTVWGRTTTGQAIACDHVIEEIARECARELAELKAGT